jgi:four helix bundle protein
VASNIAEGKGRASDKELLQFLNRARGSLFEIETQLQIAGSLGYVAAPGEILQRTEEIAKMLNGIIGKIKQVIEEAAA